MRPQSRWLVVPVGFAALLAVTLMVRWLPAAIDRAQDAYGLGQVIGGNILLTWKAIQRGFVALLVTLPVLSLLPPIQRRHVVCVSIAAVIAEMAAEFSTAAIVGARVGLNVQLLATALAYSVVLLGAGLCLRRGHMDAA